MNERIDFIDLVEIVVKAGDGGDGAVSFRREKYVPFGGPDGGDGGDGGFVFIVADPTLSTLYHLTGGQRFVAEDGERGRGKNKHGRSGRDLIVPVPVGTVVRDATTHTVLADLDVPGSYCCVARGGKGGRGNARFKSPTNQAPKMSEAGVRGEERRLILELKLLADAGLIGYPNVGKSSIIAMISNARPKIANYHFTTLVPNLGVVVLDGRPEATFVVADVPGLIEGASQGKGLGNVFLKHVERCSVLVHVLDVAGSEGRDPLRDYYNIRSELESYDPRLLEKPEFIVANKADLLDELEAEHRARELEKITGRRVLLTSAATGLNMRQLKFLIWEFVKESRKLMTGTIDLTKLDLKKPEPISLQLPDRVDIQVLPRDSGEFRVESEYVRTFLQKFRKDPKLMLRDILEILERHGLEEKLRAAGVKDGDTVWIEGVEFVYKE